MLELGVKNVFLATGSSGDLMGGRSNRSFEVQLKNIFTPDDIMGGVLPKSGQLVIYDDDQIYLGGVLADHLSDLGFDVVFVTPANNVSPWCENTLEQQNSEVL